MKAKTLLLIALLICAFISGSAQAQDNGSVNISPVKHNKKIGINNNNINSPNAIRFTVANGNWSSALIWNGGTLPLSGDDITIQNNVVYNIPGSFTAASLEIAPGATLTLNAPALTVTALYLTGGALINSAADNITMSAGGMIYRVEGSSIAVSPAGTSYDLTYWNSIPITTGAEIQNNTVVRDLYIDGDVVNLNRNATVNGNLFLTGGNLSINAFTLTLNGKTAAVFGILTGGASSNLTAGGTGNFTLPTIVSGILNTLTINKTAGDIVTLSTDLQVTNILDIESGNINTAGKIFTLGTGGANTGNLVYNAGANTGVITGKFIRWFGTSVNAQPVKFPVGNSTYSSPRMVTIQFTTAPSAAGTLTAQFVASDPGYANSGPLTDAGGYIVDTYSHTGYWQIDASALTGGTYSVGIYPTGFIGMNVFAQLRVLKRPASGNVWTLTGTHVNGDASPRALRSGLSGFSQFALGGNFIDNPLDGPLPVELVSFSDIISGNDVKLSWTTASEINNQGFEIYRKSEQADWNKIGFVNGSGTVNTPVTYNYSDKNLNTGRYSYKLKQIDYNGNYEYFIMSGIAEIGVPEKFTVEQNYPNPFNPSTTIGFSIPQNAFVSLKVYNVSGKEIATLVNSQKTAGNYSVNFNADTYNLSSGIYFYKISAGNYTEVKKLTLIK